VSENVRRMMLNYSLIESRPPTIAMNSVLILFTSRRWKTI